MLDAVEQRMESVQRSLEKKGAPDALFSEQMVLGAVLSGNAEMDDISLVNPSSFSLEKHRIIYHRMLDLHRRGIAVGYASLAQSLTDHDELQSVGGLSYLTDLHLDVPSRLRIDHHLELIEQRAQAVRFLDAVLTESQRVIHDPNSYQEAKEKILQAAKHEVARTDEEKRMFSGRDIVGDRINSFYGKQTPGVQTGIGILDKQTYGLHEGELIILGARPSDGKAQHLDAPVKTPSGWSRIGDLKVGDRVASVDGAESIVTGVFPQGIKQVYRVTFSDGRSTECCGEHLWSVHCASVSWPVDRVLTTDKIRDMLKAKRSRTRYSIPLCSGDVGTNNEPIPMRPWLLGYLLGNGYLCGLTPKVSVPDIETVERLKQEVAFYGCTLHKTKNKNNIDYTIVISDSPFAVEVGVHGNPITWLLKKIGAYGCRSWEKVVPDVYLTADRETRMELLRGLLDSDGTSEKNGHVNFSSASLRLALNVQELVRSLGGIAPMSSRIPFYTYKGQRLIGRESYRVAVIMQEPKSVFWLTRKWERALERKGRSPRLTFKSIESVGERECVCIAVSHPSKLYITNDYIVTHNTALLTQVCANAAFQGCNTQIISLEMGKDQLLQRTVCQLASASYHLLRCGQLTPEERLRITEQDSRIGSAPFYISDAVTWNLLEIKSHLKRQLAAGTPVDMLAIDYLQLMPITHSGKNDRRDLELGEVTRGLKLIAKEFKCRIILLSQLNRDNEKQNRKPTKSDLRDSGSIEADADLIWLLWHDKARYKDGQRYREAEIILEKQRNGPVGPVKVYFDMVSACFVDR